MKFLVDENLSPLVAELLSRSGHDAVHVREIVSRRPAELAGIILAQLDVLEQHLASGAIVAITPTGSRVRSLPLR